MPRLRPRDGFIYLTEGNLDQSSPSGTQQLRSFVARFTTLINYLRKVGVRQKVRQSAVDTELYVTCRFTCQPLVILIFARKTAYNTLLDNTLQRYQRDS